MASLTKKRTSPFFFACYRDHTGRQCRRTTHERDPQVAQRVADLFESVAQRKINARRIRQTVQQICREVGGEEVFQSATVAEYCKRWLAQRKREVKPSSYESYERALKKFLTFLGSRAASEVCDITKHQVTSWRDSNATKVSTGTANGDLRIIKMLFKGARRDELVDVDPTEFVASLKREANALERRPFTLEELRRLLEVCDPEWRSMVLFGIYSGQRLGDLASLTWNAIDPVRDELHLVTRKRGRRITIPLALPLKEHILTLPTPDAPDAPVHPKAYALMERDGRVRCLSSQFADILAAAGLRAKHMHTSRGIGRDARREALALSFHCLRHTAVSMLRDCGAPEAVVMELVGHDSVEISRHYSHVGREALQKAAQLLPRL